MRRFLSSLAISAVALSAGLSPVRAAERVMGTASDGLAIAVELVAAGRLGDADGVVGTLLGGALTFEEWRAAMKLQGQIAYLGDDPARAANIFASVLEADSSDIATRADYASSLFAAREDRKAERQLRKVLSADPPERLAAQAKAQLQQIDARRVVRVNFRASAAPSTNINAATSSRSVDLFGFLPAPLDDDARAQSGVGVGYALSGALTPQLSERTRGQLAARGNLLDYQGSAFDQGSARLEAGFKRSIGRPGAAFVSAQIAQDYRSFGGEPYSQATSLRLGAQLVVSQRMMLAGEASVGQTTYDLTPDRDGPVYAIGVQALYALWPSMTAGVSLSVTREETKAASLANTQSAIGLPVYLSPPGPLRVSVQPRVTWRQFDAENLLFADTREDVTVDVSTQLTPKTLTIGGFRPSLSYQYTDNRSSIDFFDYDRHTVDVGIERGF